MRRFFQVFVRMDEVAIFKRILFAESWGHRRAQKPNDGEWIVLVSETGKWKSVTEANSVQLPKKPRLKMGCYAAAEQLNI